MFELSSTVVYPGYGVAKISREIVKKIENKEIFFYELNFINKDVKILVPKINLNSVGIRLLSDEREIKKILGVFFEMVDSDFIQRLCMVSWNRRSKEYQNKIRKGDVEDIAFIYRDLKLIEKSKLLSFGEKAVLNQVEDLLSEEIGVVYNKNIQEASASLRNFVAECFTGKGNFYFLEKDFNLFVYASKGDVRI